MLIETILGVVTGIVGNVMTTVTNVRTQKLKNEHDLKMREFDIKEREQEAQLQIAVDTAHSQNEVEKMEAEAYVKSMESANADILTDVKLKALSDNGGKVNKLLMLIMGLVDAFRAFIRPGLTAYLVGLTTVITFHAISILNTKGDFITAVQAQELFTNVTDIVIYLTVSCVTWWFGDRRVAKFAYRLNDGNKQDKQGY
ncbi:MAG TPA: hypothetical protein PKH58_01420 [Paludibacteraceae bacterium]|nr:hypothetical protein [Paludibacteraceae bacterium]